MFCKIPLSLWLTFLCSICSAEIIKEEFNSLQDMGQFWEISSWENDNRKFAPENVSVDNGVLVLKLSASPQGVKPVCGEIYSKRNNFLYGSYRASIKISNGAGGVVGWFVYKDEPDLHEVDIEFLTRKADEIHFTLHHISTSVDYQKKAISFDPAADFHEYRYDWYPDKVEFYIDSQLQATLTNQVPDAACMIMLNHWSGNIANWGGPAPTQDIYMYVDYMHYYSDFTEVHEPLNTSASSKFMLFTMQPSANFVGIHTVTGWTSLKIFTMQGKCIETYTNEDTGPGLQMVQWNASRKSSGVYYLELATPQGKQRSPITLIK